MELTLCITKFTDCFLCTFQWDTAGTFSLTLYTLWLTTMKQVRKDSARSLRPTTEVLTASSSFTMSRTMVTFDHLYSMMVANRIP